MTTDPIIISSNRLSDPQLLNAYAYVRNNPLRFVDLNGEDLFLAGSVDDAKAMLCQILGSDCIDGGKNLDYDAKTNSITVDLTKVDLGNNEGAKLIDDLVNSDNRYGFTVGSKMETSQGKKDVNRLYRNLPSFPDQGFEFKPPSNRNALVAIDPSWKNAINRNNCPNCSESQAPPTWGTAFHELAEAFGKIDLGAKTYAEGHQYALDREARLREQRPGLNSHFSFGGDKRYMEIRK